MRKTIWKLLLYFISHTCPFFRAAGTRWYTVYTLSTFCWTKCSYEVQ